MFKSRTAGVLLVLSVLGGCGQAPQDQAAGDTAAAPSAQRSIKIRNEWQEKLLKLNDADRDLTLRRAVTDDGGSCSKISGSKYQQDYKGMAMWIAHCSGGDWAVYISPSGVIQARACKDIPMLNQQNAKLDLPTCHLRPADPLTPVPEPRWPEPPAPPKV